MPQPYFAFLLRLWKSADAGSWQASLENPHTRQVIGFNSLERLYAFLEQLPPGADESNAVQQSVDYNQAGVQRSKSREGR